MSKVDEIQFVTCAQDLTAEIIFIFFILDFGMETEIDSKHETTSYKKYMFWPD